MANSRLPPVLWRYSGVPYVFLWRAIEVGAIQRLVQAHGVSLDAGIDLDVGCGDGVVGAALTTCIGLGVDLDARAMRWSRRRRVYRALARASATALPLADRSQRLALCNCVLEHIPDDGAALAEMARVLAPAGQLILTLAATPLPRLALGEAASGEARTAFDRSLNHHHYYTLDAIRERLAILGLRVVGHSAYLGVRETRRWYELRARHMASAQRRGTTPLRRRVAQLAFVPTTLSLLPMIRAQPPPVAQEGAGLALLAVKG
jgi:SAM-dependent methyltransferase